MIRPDPYFHFKVEEPSGRTFYADTPRELMSLGIKTRWIYAVAKILQRRECTWMTVSGLLIRWVEREHPLEQPEPKQKQKRRHKHKQHLEQQQLLGNQQDNPQEPEQAQEQEQHKQLFDAQEPEQQLLDNQQAQEILDAQAYKQLLDTQEQLESKQPENI